MVRTLSIFAFTLLLCGCASDDKTKPLDMGGEDGTKIATVIEEINEAKSTQKKFSALFSSGSAPSGTEYKKYNQFAYYIVGKPSVSGTTATAKVSVQNEREGKEASEKEWSFVKEGDAWKIKSAPLP